MRKHTKRALTLLLALALCLGLLPTAALAEEEQSYTVTFDANGGRISQFNGKTIPALTSGEPPFTVDAHSGVDQNSGIGWTDTDENGRLSSLPVAEREGYTLDGWYVLGKSAQNDAYAGKEVDIPSGSKKADLSTVFTSDTLLAAKWTVLKDGEAAPEAEAPKPAAPKFTDVPPTSVFADAISWAVENGITIGKTADSFCPNDACTRAQIVTFLWRAAGSPKPALTETQYMDVTNPDAYFYKAVQWAAEMDMEYSGTFDPHKTCDRASAVYFIWKANGSPKATAKASFTDMPEEPASGGQWYWPDLLDAVDWAVEQGVTTGKTAAIFGPDNPCTRGQIVTFLYRAYEK